MKVLDSPTNQILIETKKIENPHPFLFIFIDCIESITLGAHYLIDCSHDAMMSNGKVIRLSMVSVQWRSTSHRWNH